MSEELLTLDRTQLADFQVQLGLGTEGTDLVLGEGAVPLDCDPFLNDVCVASVTQLGHHDVVPRSYDWENLLALVEPGEELLWIVDYDLQSEAQGHHAFRVRVGLRFGGAAIERPEIPEERRRRFQAFLSQLMRQAFPESLAEVEGPLSAWRLLSGGPAGDGARTFCVTGAPSPKDLSDDRAQEERDEDRRAYQSLNDVVETCIGLGSDFRLVFVVGRLSQGELAEEFHRVTSLRDAIHPLVRGQRQVSHAEAVNEQKQEGESVQAGGSQKDPEAALVPGVKRILNLALKTVNWPGRLFFDRPPGFAQFHDAKPTRTWNKTTTENTTHGTTKTDQVAITRESLRSDLDLADATLERYAQSLYEARGTGGFRGAVFVQARGEAAGVIASSVRGVLSGTHSKDHPLSVFEIRGPAGALFQSTWPILPVLAPAPPVLSVQQACQILLLPEAELPGLALHHAVFYGRNASPPREAGGSLISLGPDAFGIEAHGERRIRMPEGDLFRHLLVAGTTGSGKTYRALRILQDLQHLTGLRVVVFETAKRTYRGAFRRIPGQPPLVYTLGEAAHPAGSRFRPLRLNPFFFEPGTSLKRHVSVLSEALSELLPVEAMIGPKMREAVERCYADLGWDIERSAWTGDGLLCYPSPLNFVVQARRIAAELNYGPEVSANYRGALEARTRVFLDATFQDIFSHGGNATVAELFPRDVVVEFEELPPSEIDIPAFVMTLLLSRLRAVQLRELEAMRRGACAATEGLPSGWLVVVEEAHNVLRRDREAQQDSRDSTAGRLLLESVVRLLQEGRELRIGVMVVDQSPAMLARSVIKNTNTKIVMRLEDGAEMEELGQTLGLEERAWRHLGILQQGEAIVKAGYMTRPVKSSPYPQVDSSDSVVVAHAEKRPAPSYLALDRLWREALAGQREPDAAWLAAVCEAAVHALDLAAFAGRRALINLGTDPLLKIRRAQDFFAALGNPGLTWENLALAAAAWSRHVRTLGMATALLPLERRLLAACLDLPVPPPAEPRVNDGVVWFAARALQPCGGDEPGWRLSLGRLAVAEGGGWTAASADLRRRIAADDPRRALTFCLQLRTLSAIMTEDEAVGVANAEPFDAVRLAAACGRLVDQVTGDLLPDGAPPALQARVHSAADLLRRACGLALIHRFQPGREADFRALAGG